MRSTQYNNEVEFCRLLRKCTSLKVVKGAEIMLDDDYYASISTESKLEGPHIAVFFHNNCEDYFEVKVCIYFASMTIGSYSTISIALVQDILDKLQIELDNVFGSENWFFSNSETTRWRPLNRSSFYLQMPSFTNAKVINMNQLKETL